MFDETAELYDLFYAWKDYEAEAARLSEEIGQRMPQARTLLDVACGTGMHLQRLRTWYRVEGFDIDPRLLAVARKRLGTEVPLHEGDMREFDLGRDLDVVTCLYLRPGGLLLVEPWFSPDTWDEGHLPRPMVIEGDGFNAVRTNATRIAGRRTVMEFHYLITRPDVVEHRQETHDMGLFTSEEYRSAFEQADLAAHHDADGLMGRGLWIGQKPE